MTTIRLLVVLILIQVLLSHRGVAGEQVTSAALTNHALSLRWKTGPNGWQIHEVLVHSAAGELRLGTPSGEYTLLYSATKPSNDPLNQSGSGQPDWFPKPGKRNLPWTWDEANSPVALNVAGEARSFYPTSAKREDDGAYVFSHQDELAEVSARWALDAEFPGDVRVTLTLTAKQAGWFSLATPTLSTVSSEELAWAVVPGCFQGSALQSDFVLAGAYGQGLPNRPILARERSVSTLASLLTAKNGATLAVIADPDTATDPWTKDHDTRQVWRLGLSHMNRQGALTPTLYHPVLGQEGSRLEAGEHFTYGFRYTLRAAHWFTVLRHAIYDVYRFSESLALRESRESLTDRILALHSYLTDDRTSRWRTETFNGLTIGAQEYDGPVIGSNHDALKNSDYGAMWMLARATGDLRLTRDRLPFARAFKLAQQQSEPGFFQGAAVGQYYLAKSHCFVEEWGDYVEPIGLTYYTMLDLGNILLFEPDDAELRARLRLGADRLLSWQHPDGHWEVAYDRASERPRFAELRDLRPTFYGLLVAYRILKEEKYLAAARRGADWLVEHAVNEGKFLGVCGDTYFAPDFTTAQIAQALLDLHEITGDTRYRDAGIAAARFYVTSVYTHPIATRAAKEVKGVPKADWEINQAGLGFEHGGLIGTANFKGPILLASHAGLFVRVHQLTGEPLFLDLARSAAVGRDSFVDPATHVASYYWNLMNKGAGEFPHHAWWQIGWITDYLMSEIALRSGNHIVFPRGFITPKVGPHGCYGFAPGKVFGEPVDLAWGAVPTGNPAVNCIVTRAVGRNRILLVLLNEGGATRVAQLAPNAATLTHGTAKRWTAAHWVSHDGIVPAEAGPDGNWSLTLPSYGLAVLALDYEGPSSLPR
jgi:hypothetical protein